LTDANPVIGTLEEDKHQQALKIDELEDYIEDKDEELEELNQRLETQALEVKQNTQL